MKGIIAKITICAFISMAACPMTVESTDISDMGQVEQIAMVEEIAQ